MSDSYLPDNAPRDILLSLEELAARKLPHAPTFRKAAAEIERLRQLLSDTNTYYAECIAEREDLRAENEKLHREAAIRIDQIKRELEAHLRTISDYNRAMVKNDKLRKALEPFARMAADYEDWETEKITMIVLLYHLRAAAAAIRGEE